MTIRIFNTLTKQKEVLKPKVDNKIKMFVCGPTVYDYAHIGNAKTFTQFDFIVKYLRYRGYDVFYLQNITDIDDKIINRSREKEISWDNLSTQYTNIFLEDMAILSNNAVTEYAKATDFIPQILNQVRILEEKGIAYRTKDGIYFEIDKFKDYGNLSGRTEVKDTDGVSRIDADPEKKNPNDFCLWKFAKEGEPFWETSLGKGRPGWHIEDTAIAEHFFGTQYDVHGGAVDLIFPHHEAEIAQMEAISDKKPFVKYWLHTGFLSIKEKKMSKSLGNFLTIREATQIYDPKILRFFYISSKYRSTLEYSEKTIDQATQTLNRINEFLFNINKKRESSLEKNLVNKLRSDVIKSLDDDFNSPKALSKIYDYIKARNIDGEAGNDTEKYFQEINRVFGVFTFNNDRQDDSEIEKLVNLREEKRKQGNYSEADNIRDKLINLGIKIYDGENGSKWRRIK